MLDSSGITQEVEKFLEGQTAEPFELTSPIAVKCAAQRRLR
jgi:hypothetical protein